MKWIALAAVFLLPLAVSAQQETPDPGDVPPTATVTVEIDKDHEVDLDANEPLSACVVRSTIGLDGPESDEVVVFVRGVDGKNIQLGSFVTEATAALAEATVGQCLALGGKE